MPRCRAVAKSTGKKCRRNAATDNGYCKTHDPAYATGVGRPTKLTRELVDEFAVILETAIRVEDACDELMIDASTYREWCKQGADDIGDGKPQTQHALFSTTATRVLASRKRKVTGTLVGLATGQKIKGERVKGDPQACALWLRLVEKEGSVDRIEQTGADGGPMETVVHGSLDLSRLTDAELEEAQRISSKARGTE